MINLLRFLGLSVLGQLTNPTNPKYNFLVFSLFENSIFLNKSSYF